MPADLRFIVGQVHQSVKLDYTDKSENMEILVFSAGVYTRCSYYHNGAMESDWTAGDTFNLDRVAAVLEGLEETIIYRLLDRCQFARNAAAYQRGASSLPGLEDCSLLQARLHMQEEMDARFGRFMVPEERPFSAQLPAAQRTPPKASNEFSINNFDVVKQGEAILPAYDGLLTAMCPPGDDGHYGSSVEMDVSALQAIARRIHFGSLYVAESKYRAEPAEYLRLIQKRDQDGLMQLLTRQIVEERILARVREKIDYLQRSVNTRIRRVVDPELIMNFYRITIIPLTKQGEVAWLLAQDGLQHE